MFYPAYSCGITFSLFEQKSALLYFFQINMQDAIAKGYWYDEITHVQDPNMLTTMSYKNSILWDSSKTTL